jgi:hypothetical protein
MFTIEWGDSCVPGHSAGYHGWVCYVDTNSSICSIHTWAFSSCACFSLQGFNLYHAFTKEQAEEFFKYLSSMTPPTNWQPGEIYFLLTHEQSRDSYLRELVAHPCVRQVDSFTNKAHGGKLMCLFRYSKNSDFKRES